MSNLLVQNIKHTNNTSAQTIDTSGRTTAVLNNDTTYRSDGGAVTQNMVQGLTKVWALATMNGNTIYDSFNLSSIGDDATGQIGFNFTNNIVLMLFYDFQTNFTIININHIIHFKIRNQLWVG